LAEALGDPFQLHVAQLRQPWKSLWPGMIPSARFIFRNPELFDQPPPRIAITSGRQAVMAALYLKKRFGDRVFTVHVQHPKIDPSRFDLVVAPEHDGLRGPNVVTTIGAVHHITRDVLDRAAAGGPVAGLERLTRPIVAVLIGGPTRHYQRFDADLARLEDALAELVRSEHVNLAILPSRRTPQAVIDRMVHRFGQDQLVWNRQGANPYLCALALATHVIVTGDSVSMMTEASGTGRPVYVAYLTESRPARRFRLFHQSLERAGITRPFEGRLEHWSYMPRNDSVAVAAIIRERVEGAACRF
jgi:mitochondrial fission protein ELM1